MKTLNLKKAILLTLIFTVLISLASLMVTKDESQAAYSSTGLRMGIRWKHASDGLGYVATITNPAGNTKTALVNEIYNTSGVKKTIYCLRGGPGFGNGSVPGSATERTYNYYFDLKDPSSITGNYRNYLPTGTNYNSLMWLLDNIYVPAQSGASQAEINAASAQKTAVLRAALPTGRYLINCPSEEPIIVAQQIAIWAVTNNISSNATLYQFCQSSTATTNCTTTHTGSITDTYSFRDEWGDLGYIAEYQAYVKWLIDQAYANSSYSYTSTNTTPITAVNSTVGSKKVGNYYVLGPYKFNNANPSGTFDVTATLKASNGTVLSPALCNSAGTTVSGTIADKIKSGAEFYLRIPSTTTGIIDSRLVVTTSVNTKTATAWIIDSASEQPVVVLEPRTITTEIPVVTVGEREFDLALRKYIYSVNGIQLTNSKAPTIDVAALQSGTATTAEYRHRKDPVTVTVGDDVVYVIKVYNEGDIDGYAAKIVDRLPNELRLKAGSTINSTYGWTASDDGRTITTEYLKKGGASGLGAITAFNKSTGALATRELQIECTVQENPQAQIITNIAYISDFTDADGNAITDRDSAKNNTTIPSDATLPNYKGNSSNKEDLTDKTYHYKGQEDDDDFDKLCLEVFDLALRKWITSVNGVALTNSKEPTVDTTKLKNGTATTAEYRHRKDPTKVQVGDKVVYTIRIYNEGPTSGYVNLVEDYLPTGLQMVDASESTINRSNGWVVVEGTNGKKIRTEKLKYGSSTDNLLQAYAGQSVPDYKDLQIECIVTNDATAYGKVMTNIASIITFANASGKTITDRDSAGNNLVYPGENYLPSYKGNSSNKSDLRDSDYHYKGQEDDDDFDKITLETNFDLALRKYITKVNDKVVNDRTPDIDVSRLADGSETTAEYRHQKQPVQIAVGDKVIYDITVYNEGLIDGYANMIEDYLPEGLELVPAAQSTINTTYRWEAYTRGDGRSAIRSDYLKYTAGSTENLIRAFDGTTLNSRTIQVECIVTARAKRAVVMTNIASITAFADSNGNPIADRDSNADNLDYPDDLPGYRGNRDNKSVLTDKTYHYKGQEDDDDFEKLVLDGEFDLALRKYITALNGAPVNTKTPVVDVAQLQDGTKTTAEYKHRKDPTKVKVGDSVIYTIRVYNEGGINGYAEVVEDYLPEGLTFKAGSETNVTYGWTATGTEGERTIVQTSYLSRANGEQNMIRAFNKETGAIDYKELKIECTVNSKARETSAVQTNIASIVRAVDTEGNTVTDRDSTPGNTEKPSDLPGYHGRDNKDELTDSNYHYKGQEDDDDFDKVIVGEKFDLALRKFITKINTEVVDSRIPVFRNENGTYRYEHDKTPLTVQTTDIVEYTLRIYNEGDVDGYAKLVKDDIPEGLEFIPENSTNQKYGWQMLDKDGNVTTDPHNAKSIHTDYLAKAKGEDNLLVAFNPDTMSEPAHKDLKVAFKVIAPNTTTGIITNTAEIKDDEDKDGNPVDDIDSTPNNDRPEEDDIDVEHIKLQYFDLALRKFIMGVNDEQITDRVPKFKVENDKYIYEHTKEPVLVHTGDTVYYTLRIFNEGTMDGYANLVEDDIPDGLEFLPKNPVNEQYRWVMLDKDKKETNSVANAKYIRTDFLEDTKLKAFDITAYKAGTIKEPDYADIRIAFKVVEPTTSNRILINSAQISDDKGPNKEEVTDIDSIPDKWIDGEDDQDIEKVRVQFFDLALRKWITQTILIEGGAQKVVDTGHDPWDDPEEIVKVELYKGTLSTCVVKFKYSIRVYNQGEIPGYATEVSDYIPQGLQFIAADNPDWREVDGKVVTNKLANTLLNPGEYADVEIVLQWINDENNLGLKTNTAEISEDKNEYNTPDIDSVPNNKKHGEDDIDIAEVILSIKTGFEEITPYVGLSLGIIGILAAGIVVIKKYVL